MQLDENIGKPLHHSQHDCSSQEGRRLGYQPPPYDQTPCFLNEKTCTRQFAQTSLGNNVKVTFDWKHLMYEDYDRALFKSWEEDGGPHYVFVSPGESVDKDILTSYHPMAKTSAMYRLSLTGRAGDIRGLHTVSLSLQT